MIISTLELKNFKNFENQTFEFSPGINCVVGENGIGKTNLLDAIYYLSFGKSALSLTESQLIKHGESFLTVKGTYQCKDQNPEFFMAFQPGKKKTIKKNSNPTAHIKDHIGEIPLVFVSPNDHMIILGASEEQRKFFDRSISQTDSKYLNFLLKYQKVLKQRNKYLKSANFQIDEALLETYDDRLIEFGTYISTTRNRFVADFNPAFLAHYDQLSDQKEAPQITYQSHHLSANLKAQFKKHLQRDIALSRTSVGVHLDKYLFTIDNHLLKKFGSQGQQKTFLLALKLAEFQKLSENTGIKPLLLLDDIFDKLDPSRISNLLANVSGGKGYDQIFISDAISSRIEQMNEGSDLNLKIHYLSK